MLINISAHTGSMLSTLQHYICEWVSVLALGEKLGASFRWVFISPSELTAFAWVWMCR